MPVDPMELSRKAIEAWNAHDLDAVTDLAADDAILMDSAVGEVRGRDALRENARNFMTAFPDLHLDVANQMAQGNMLCQEWVATGTHEGDLMGLEPTHRRVEVHGCVIARYGEDGRMQEMHRYWNPGEMMTQLGAAPQAAGATS